MGQTGLVGPARGPRGQSAFGARGSARRSSLPAPLTSLIGRERDLEQVERLLIGCRLLTLTGSGGIGKTTLAHHTALARVERGQNCWWVDLSPATSDDVLDTLTSQLGTDAQGLGALTALIGDADLLLVCDNAEHIIDAAATAAHALLVACQGLRLLVTSREPLGVPGEVVWRVPSLSVPEDGGGREALDAFDATRLFVERARQALPDLVLDDRAADRVTAICRRLDGVPLAIELAAARLRSMSLERVHDGLNDVFALLTGGARTVVPRQRTIAASIDWSVDLLDDRDRRVLRRLAVFATSFPIDAAAVVTGEPDAEAAVERLVERSLVRFDHRVGRHHLLEVMRQHGVARMQEAGELDEVRLRHALRLAERFTAHAHGLSTTPRDDLVAEVPDAIASLTWAMTAAPTAAYLLAPGLSTQSIAAGTRTATRIMDFLVATAETGACDAPMAWAAAVAAMAGTAAVQDDRQDVLALLDRAVPLLSPDDRFSRRSLAVLAASDAALAGHCEPLEQLLEDLEKAREQATLRRFVAGASALVRTACGDHAVAAAHLETQRRALEEEHLPYTPATATHGYTAAQMQAVVQGRLREAVELVRRLESDRSTNPFTAAVASFGALAAYTTGADDVLGWIRDLVEDPAPVQLSGTVHNVDMVLAFAGGNVRRACEHALAGWAGVRRLGVLQGQNIPFAVATLLLGDRPDDARRVVAAYEEDVEQLGRFPWQAAQLEHAAAMVAIVEERHHDAWDAAHRQLHLAVTRGWHPLALDALAMLAQLADRRGNPPMAARLAGACQAGRQRIGYVRPVLADPTPIATMERIVASATEHAVLGAALTLDEVGGYAARMRGHRGRPALGWDALTPTERRVTDFAAAGLGNADIASRLLMSPATVKTHLTHIYGKLGVRNRTELASVVASRRPPGS
jgi:predicted ATPase/DNA-binding CsgD family transcriptional regulator